MDRFGLCNGPHGLLQVRAWSSLLIRSWHRRLHAEARRLVNALDALHSLLTLLLTLKSFVADLMTIPTGAFVAFALALCFSSLLAAPTSLLAAPAALLAAPTWPFSLKSLSPFPFALVVFAFAFCFLGVGAIWGYVSCLITRVTNAAAVVLESCHHVFSDPCRCPLVERRYLLFC